MLRTSPSLSPSANASPNSFRYAPTRSPHLSAREIAAKLRLSSRSTQPPSPSIMSPPPRAHNAMRPFDSAVSSSSSTSTDVSSVASGSLSDVQRTSVSSAPVQPANIIPSNVTTIAEGVDSTAASGTAMAPEATSNALTSPTKRRGSPHQEGKQAIEAANAAESPSPVTQPSKRLKPGEQPPKILPQKYELCDAEDMVELIAHMLAELIATNDAIRTSSGGLTRFHSRTSPGISVRDYLHRLAKHATLTPPLLLVMVYYIDRLCVMYAEFTINTLTVHRFLITAATVAAKGLSDSFWNNTTYARVGGVRVAELKLLELEFLYRVDWKIVPNPEVLVAYYGGLVERMPGYVLESNDSPDKDMDRAEDELRGNDVKA